MILQSPTVQMEDIEVKSEDEGGLPDSNDADWRDDEGDIPVVLASGGPSGRHATAVGGPRGPSMGPWGTTIGGPGVCHTVSTSGEGWPVGYPAASVSWSATNQPAQPQDDIDVKEKERWMLNAPSCPWISLMKKAAMRQNQKVKVSSQLTRNGFHSNQFLFESK